MPQASTHVAPRVFPFRRYGDAPAAIKWLTATLGFEEQMVVEGEGGTIAHAQLRLGDAVVIVGTGRDLSGDPPPEDVRDVAEGLYVFVPDVDAHYAHARESGASIFREIEDMDYGSREYSVLDPGGYYWSFGTYLPE
jgi:uncharacterized glyoxalase superfamily protein PhnB